jgi:glycerophosphoryl diester phosphodiesterase
VTEGRGPDLPQAPDVSGRPRRAPLVLGHRGYSARFPENTLRAFRAALDAGADGVECDLHRSADGRYVVIHDPSTLRTAGAGGPVADMHLDELRRLDVGGGERIPELAELLTALPSDAYLDLELKAGAGRRGDCRRILRLLEGRRPGTLMVSSFSPLTLLAFRRRGCTVGLLVSRRAAGAGLLPLLPVLLLLRPRFINLPAGMLGGPGARRAWRLVGLLRRLGLSVLFWGVDTEENAMRAAELADIIVTDEVEIVRRVISARSPPFIKS